MDSRKLELHKYEEILDRAIGEKGTRERTSYDARMDEFIRSKKDEEQYQNPT
jgi:hypothetical protein